MLSISSEDEGAGTSSHRAAARHQVKPAAHARGVAAEDEALEWDEEDEEEPVSWNHVDQSEVSTNFFSELVVSVVGVAGGIEGYLSKCLRTFEPSYKGLKEQMMFSNGFVLVCGVFCFS